MNIFKSTSLIKKTIVLSFCLGLVSCAVFSGNKEFSKEASAPIQLEYVDFRITKGRSYEHWSQKLGKYKFRIFGCRRDTDDIEMNSGRVFKRDMRFFRTFFEEMEEHIRVVVNPKNPYYELTEKIELPDYYLTAEVTDYYMNVCDGFDWKTTEKTNLRKGTSEITVTWRITDIGKDKLYWKGSSKGYGEIIDAVENGETELVEKAFADALGRLHFTPGFRETLMNRVPQRYKLRQYALYSEAITDYELTIKMKQKELILREIERLKILETMRAKGLLKLKLEEHTKLERELLSDSLSRKELIKQKLLDRDGELSLEELDSIGESSVEGLMTTGNTEITGHSLYSNLANDGQTDISGFVIDKNKSDSWIGLGKLDQKPQEAYNSLIGGYFIDTDGKFYIDNIPPFKKLTPNIMYKIRNSVVSAKNKEGLIGSGIILTPKLVLTSNKLITLDNSAVKLTTVNQRKLSATAIRKNPFKDTALLLLEAKTEYAPMPLRISLPDIGEEVFIGLGAPTLENGEGYLDDSGMVKGYRYSEENGAEIIVDTYVQENTLGGALIDKEGRILGMAHSGKRTDTSEVDFFIPISTALKSMDVYIKDRPYPNHIPEALKQKMNNELKDRL